ncbi:ribosomal rna large subunit methyltransferase i [Phtheirospermum japonicum]|uniref:Ribosomal rna large subunit methyltransferase i n=1 Tax=Phtheirospermum japonicum TaxID=374723 RepID=A0A830B7A2_9LAMI|nr:ribosomal rna large subunit methyltransferase i [Phtheirospermum japonicum]
MSTTIAYNLFTISSSRSKFHLRLSRKPKMLLGARFLMSKTLTLASAPPAATALQDIASNHPKGIAKVVLKKGKTQLFKDGSPMVYSGAVDRIIGRPPPVTGDVVLVTDGAEKPIGWGLYNSVSMFCVRLMQLEDEASRDPCCALNVERLLENRINDAVVLRERLGLPSTKTNAYRLVNSEGDRLSGLIVDIFGHEAVIASSAAWVEKYKQQIKDCISKISNVNHITWRPSIDILKEEGLDLSDSGDVDLSDSQKMAKVVENGISYLVSMEGQKTGFYADQRENRQYISSISEGQKVLDICCYTGGFALNAASGGALSVTGVDSSAPALDIAKKNIVLNNLDSQEISFLREDATHFMKSALSKGNSWDIVILDPPKLAPRKKDRLLSHRRRTNAVVQTLTAALSLDFRGAASMSGRKITIVRQAGAGCDHPVDPSYPEGQYLSNVLLRVL